MSPTQFQAAILKFYDEKGRKNLPWQHNKTCYRVWISEVMLQQTQVATVIPYYERFMEKFPSLESLAEASQDDVLALWTGLGYYSRARNLHKCAQQIINKYAGEWPNSVEELQQLSGIGRSTAGAILSLAKNQIAVILDGNIKRVLCRFRAVEGWPGKTKVQNELWEIAEQLTPGKRVAEYNQAMMDMGATLCTRRNPKCDECPLQSTCVAAQTNRQHDFPNPKPRVKKPIRSTIFVIARNRHQVLLEKRPSSGIWGGLWSLPEVNDESSLNVWMSQHLGSTGTKLLENERNQLAMFRHTFSHFHLDIAPVLFELPQSPGVIMDSQSLKWQDLNQLNDLGLPSPVYKLLTNLETSYVQNRLV